MDKHESIAFINVRVRGVECEGKDPDARQGIGEKSDSL